MTCTNEITAPSFPMTVCNKILELKEHQVPQEPNIEVEVQVARDITITLEQQEEHTAL